MSQNFIEFILNSKSNDDIVTSLRSLLSEEKSTIANVVNSNAFTTNIGRLYNPIFLLISDEIVRRTENFEEFIVSCCELVIFLTKKKIFKIQLFLKNKIIIIISLLHH